MVEVSTTPSLQMMWEHAASWRNVLEAKGYASVNCEFKYDPTNDECRISLWFYNTDWSSTSLDEDLRKFGRLEGNAYLWRITQWVNAVPREEEAREQALLKDYARIKERIAASNLADIIKAEAETLMKMMTENILPPPPPSTEQVIEDDVSRNLPH